MHYEEELDLFCSCIRANISIMLHNTIYEINSTILLRTHFKPPSSVITSFCDHMWNLVVYMLFIAFYIAAQISISDVHILLNKITYKAHSIVIVCLLSYIINSGCCHVYFCCVKALTCMLWLKLALPNRQYIYNETLVSIVPFDQIFAFLTFLLLVFHCLSRLVCWYSALCVLCLWCRVGCCLLSVSELKLSNQGSNHSLNGSPSSACLWRSILKDSCRISFL